MTTVPPIDGLDMPDRLWADDDVPSAEDRYADLGTGLVSLAYIKAALRRGARLWCAMAIIGVLAGVASVVAFPAGYQATTQVYLMFGPYENPTTAPVDNQVIAQSRTVAGTALRRLGLTESVSSFIAGYTAAAVSPSVLQITVTAPSGDQAVRRARAIAKAFLDFRASQLTSDQKLVLTSIHQQIKQVRQTLASIDSKISSLPSVPTSPEQQAELNKLKAEQSQFEGQFSALQQGSSGSTTKTATSLAIKNSKVIDDAALVLHSRLKPPVFHAAIGLVAGLAIGLGIVIIRALVSDRLRRRDDISRALGAPVKLSVAKVPISRWRQSRRGLAAARNNDISRIVTYLGGEVTRSRRGFASLAIVPIDNTNVAAVCLTSLALSCAERGMRVVLADLYAGAPAARLLGMRETGIEEVRFENARLVVAVPHPDDIFPVGPLQSGSRGGAAADMAAACASSDVVLTLTALDPAIGGEHLPGWASAVVAFVTAGRSSSQRIRAVGEMIRLARMPRVTGVLIGADKTDESLGTTYVQGRDNQPDRV
jgi:capsular polysaccharide biosynthesis protein